MKFYLLSDNIDTKMGMRLAGIDGVVIHEAAEVERELTLVMNDPEVGVVLMTNRLISLCPEAEPQAAPDRGGHRPPRGGAAFRRHHPLRQGSGGHLHLMKHI